MNAGNFRFNERYEKVLKEAFEHFIQDEPYDFSQLRPEIYRSWERSKKNNVTRVTDAAVPVLSDERRKKVLGENDLMIKAFRKHVKKIYDVVKTSGYYLFLSDKDGWLLDIIIDQDLINSFEYDPTLVVGASRNERDAGTNAIGTCLIEGKPLSLWGEEHYNYMHKKYSCAGSPIRNKKGDIIGAISITGLKNTYQDHTLGLVISVVNSIEEELNHTAEKGENIHRSDGTTFDDIIGECPEMMNLKSIAEQVAKTDVSVLLWGESGAGKEVFANAIHNASGRAGGPFVAINCGAIPRELIESELFGYDEGAFTGARKGGKIGMLEAASGGTLFLDEIESMTLDAQVKLLRVLSSGRMSRVGGLQEIDVDFRVISATKSDLFDCVEKETFREDLAYRINTITLRIPPLRDRGKDRMLLADHFLNEAMLRRGITDYTVPKSFVDIVDSYEWHGNVRELRNVIEGIAAMTNDGEMLNLTMLPERIRSRSTMRKTFGVQAQMKMKEEDYLMRELERNRGNIKVTAEKTGIARSTLHYKINNSSRLSEYMRKWKR